MTKLKIADKVTRTFGKTGLKIRKHSPEILIVTGVVGVIASAVMACKATTKISPIVGEAKAKIEDVHDLIEHPEKSGETYTKEDGKKDLAIVYAQTGLKLTKLYAPSVTLGALSIGCILASNNVLRKRNLALAAAYTTIDTSFKDYRKRVVERFGEELDKELKYNIKTKEVEKTIVDEKGKEKTVKETVSVMDLDEPSEYARFYDVGCNGWEKDPEHNLWYLRIQQNYANEKLQSKGYLFLNEVYEMLGLPLSKAGQVVGWIYDEKNPNGDNRVDFGIYSGKTKAHRDFVNGTERTILLDFNVDGPIWEKV